MRIAIFGASSQIAKDLMVLLSTQSNHELVLYARRPDAVATWMESVGLTDRYPIADFSAFKVNEHFDAIINFVGVGNPVQTIIMGASIFEVTLKYDEMAIDYVRHHPVCRYIFLSSGAVYGASFDAPVDASRSAMVPINNLQTQDWYGVAKLHSECRHRSLAHLPIIDIRVFNYFSKTQDMETHFFITDIVRAIRDKTVFKTSDVYMARDYLHPTDFSNLVNAILTSPAANTAVDCYSKSPIDKISILNALQENFDLQYEVVQSATGINATGIKPHYYSLSRRAEDFGYKPEFTSLEVILNVVSAYFSEIIQNTPDI